MGQNVLLTGKLVTDRTKVKEILVDQGGLIITVTTEHSKVHQGEFFSSGYYNATVANTTAINVLVQVPTDISIHTYFKVLSGGDSLFEAFEGVTFSAQGTDTGTLNNNRTSTNTPDTIVTHTPTITDTVSLIWQEFIPGGSGAGSGQVTPGAVQNVASEQSILAPNTNYLFRLTNNAGSTQPLQIQLAFYEVPA